MKRKILSIAFVAISTIMFTSVANNNVNTENESQDKCKKECCKGHKMKKSKHNNAPKFNPFEGITLSDAQKEQFKALAENRKAEFKKMIQEKKEQSKANRINHKDLRKKQLDDVKQILTPEQYVQYLENIVLNKQVSQKKHKKHNHGKRHNIKCAKKDSI